MIIRPYESKDKEAVRYVCLNCDGPCDMSENAQHFILSTYCDYFIEQEPQNCFVAADENDKAVGYIICADNFDSFIEIFQKEYFTRISEKDTVNRVYASKSTLLQEKYKDKYPAHFHIDILPEYQRMGLGQKLIHSLYKHLKEKNVRGVMLSVNAENEKGINFYKKCGFTLLENAHGAEAYGMTL